MTSAEEVRELREQHEYESLPFAHDFEGQGRFQIMAARPKDGEAFADDDDLGVWILTVRPLCSGPPRDDHR